MLLLGFVELAHLLRQVPLHHLRALSELPPPTSDNNYGDQIAYLRALGRVLADMSLAKLTELKSALSASSRNQEHQVVRKLLPKVELKYINAIRRIFAMSAADVSNLRTYLPALQESGLRTVVRLIGQDSAQLEKIYQILSAQGSSEMDWMGAVGQNNPMSSDPASHNLPQRQPCMGQSSNFLLSGGGIPSLRLSSSLFDILEMQPDEYTNPQRPPDVFNNSPHDDPEANMTQLNFSFSELLTPDNQFPYSTAHGIPEIPMHGDPSSTPAHPGPPFPFEPSPTSLVPKAEAPQVHDFTPSDPTMNFSPAGGSYVPPCSFGVLFFLSHISCFWQNVGQAWAS